MAEPIQPNRRRWFRFRLRSLLVFTLLVGLLMAWIVSERQQSAFEHTIAEKLVANGIQVGFRGPFDGDDLAKQPIQQSWWRRGLGNALGTRVHVASIEKSSITNSDLKSLLNFEELLLLILRSQKIDDLGPLTELKKLRTLEISHIHVNDLRPLAGHKELHILYLVDFRSQDLATLAAFSNLRELHVNGEQVQDVSALSELKNLEQLTLINTQVTQEQVDTLQKALPKCQIFHYAIP